MIYLNNAATTYPKPQCVQEACTAVFHRLPEGQFRSSGSFEAGDIFSACQKRLGKLLGIEETKNIRFTSGSTEALNKILYGLGICASRILTTATEHNSVLRPLYNIPSIKGTPGIVPCNKEGKILPEELEQRITPEIKAVVVNHCSNVTGCIQNMEAISEIVKKRGLLLIVDVSQSAGCTLVEADGWGADAIAFTGHKSLFGIQGSGGYYIRSGTAFCPMFFGGSGKDSKRLVYEAENYEYDAGTQNGIGIAALYAASGYLLERGIEKIQREEQEKIRYLYQELSRIPSVILYGNAEENKGPVVSFNINALAASDTAYILQNSYQIVTRAGFHCASLIHAYLGTEKSGTVRVGISDLNTWEEMESLVKAVREIGGFVS